MRHRYREDSRPITGFLFGSYVGGSFDEKCDIEFLVVISTKKEMLARAIRRLEYGIQRSLLKRTAPDIENAS